MVALSVRMAESAPFLGESERVGNTSTICRQCFLMMLLVWFMLLLWFVFVVVTGWMKKETWKGKIDSGSSKNVRNQLDDSRLVAKKAQTIDQVVQNVTIICPMFSTGSQRHHERALEIRSDHYGNRRPFPPKWPRAFQMTPTNQGNFGPAGCSARSYYKALLLEKGTSGTKTMKIHGKYRTTFFGS